MPDESRYVYIYASLSADEQAWEKLAKEAKALLSKFLVDIDW
jgi:hypothetical protein